MRYALIFLVLLLVMVVPVVAQDDAGSGACPVLVEQALTIVADSCGSLSRNVVCYGHGSIEAQNVEQVALDDFANPGDTYSIQQVYTLTTAPMDAEQDVWGIAVLSLQANLPETLPGQNVTFLLYGDAQITSEVGTESAGDYEAPFQAFRFTSGIGEPQCSEAPRDGLLVQSPQGITVNFMVNGIEVEMGSTALIQGDEDTTSFTNIEGTVSVTVNGVTQAIAPGETVSVDTPDGVPDVPQAPTGFSVNAVQSAPVDKLPEPVTLPLPVGASDVRIEFCAGMSDIPIAAGQTVTFRYTWYYADEETLSQAVNTFTMSGASVSLWAVLPVEAENGLGREYVWVAEIGEPGPYQGTYHSEMPNVNWAMDQECTFMAQ